MSQINGGDDRIRTCGSLLDYNDLANRRFQPLSHVSIDTKSKTYSSRRANFVKAVSILCANVSCLRMLDTRGECPENKRVVPYHHFWKHLG